MGFLKRWIKTLQSGQCIQERRRNAIGQQFGRRPDMLYKSGCHHWRDRLPTSQRYGASRWFRAPAGAGGAGDVAAPDAKKPATATVVAHTTRGLWRSRGYAVLGDDCSDAASGCGVQHSWYSWLRWVARRSAALPSLADHRRPLCCQPARYGHGIVSSQLGHTTTPKAAGAVLWDSVLDALGGAVGASCRRHGAKPSDTRALIARGERHVRISDMQNSIEQHISARVRPFTHLTGC